jgi:hypothetical protein
MIIYSKVTEIFKEEPSEFKKNTKFENTLNKLTNNNLVKLNTYPYMS